MNLVATEQSDNSNHGVTALERIVNGGTRSREPRGEIGDISSTHSHLVGGNIYPSDSDGCGVP